MKNFNVDEVATMLKNNQSAEFDYNGVTYYLHINSDGQLVNNISEAAVTFTYFVSFESYGITEDQWNDEETICSEQIYDHECIGDPIFDEIVSSLTMQANDWINEV